MNEQYLTLLFYFLILGQTEACKGAVVEVSDGNIDPNFILWVGTGEASYKMTVSTVKLSALCL